MVHLRTIFGTALYADGWRGLKVEAEQVQLGRTRPSTLAGKLTRAASEEGDVPYRPLFGAGPEEGHHRLVELLPEAVIVHDHKKFLYVNSAGVKLLGASSPEELADRQVPDFVHPEYRQMVEER